MILLKANTFIMFMMMGFLTAGANHNDDYEKCIQTRTVTVLKASYREALVCYVNEICLLKSNSCFSWPHVKNASFKLSHSWMRRSYENFTYEPLIISDNDEEDFDFDVDSNEIKFKIDKKSLNLMFMSIKPDDQGIYVEVIYNTTVIKEYHVTVIEQFLARYPVYELEFSEKPHKLANDSKLQKFILWSEWSSCVCLSNNQIKNETHLSYRTRKGDCYLRSTDLISNDSIHLLFVRYSNSIPCESKLLPNESHVPFSLWKRYIMYGDCYTSCWLQPYSANDEILIKTSLTDQPFDRKDYERLKNVLDKDVKQTLLMPKVYTIDVEPKSNLILRCNLKQNVDATINLNVFWKTNDDVGKRLTFNHNQTKSPSRIFVDRMFRLIVHQVTADDPTNYTCYLNNQENVIYLVNIRFIIAPTRIYSFLNNFGAFLVLISLCSTVLLSAYFNRNFF